PGRRPFKAVARVRIPLGARMNVCETCSRTLLGPVEQLGVLATLSRWRPRVQIPSGPLQYASAAWLGSSVGTSDRLKSDRSPVRSRPQPPRKKPPTNTRRGLLRSVLLHFKAPLFGA